MCLSSRCPAGVGKDRDVIFTWETEARRDGWPWAQLGRLDLGSPGGQLAECEPVVGLGGQEGK